MRSAWPTASRDVPSTAPSARRPKKMPRRRVVDKREILPDPLYAPQLVTKFINSVMSQGKKSTAEGILYGALNRVAEKTQDDPMKTFKKAIENVKPALEVKSRRVGGSTYHGPVEVRAHARASLAIRGVAPARGEKTMREKLAAELLDAANLRGGAMKKKDDTHKMAEANKAFA